MPHELAKKLTAERKAKIKHGWNSSKTDEENLQAWDFETRRKTHPKECPCYTGQPCHDPPINCLLCYCPEYDLSREEGGCKRGGEQNARAVNPDEKNERHFVSGGKWFYHPNLPKGKIWDCSDCDFPHKVDNIKKYLKQVLS